jgi:hypothetical protein
MGKKVQVNRYKEDYVVWISSIFKALSFCYLAISSTSCVFHRYWKTSFPSAIARFLKGLVEFFTEFHLSSLGEGMLSLA